MVTKRIGTFRELREVLASLTDEQLDSEVWVVTGEAETAPLSSLEIADEDFYKLPGDDWYDEPTSHSELMAEYPDVMAGARVVIHKGDAWLATEF